VSEDRRVELIREGVDAWEAGDVDRAIALYDPEIVVYAPPEIGNSGTFHGIDGFFAWTESWFEAWESFSQEPISIEPFGGTHVISRVSQTGVGKGSGIEVVRDATYVYDIRDGKLVYMALFFDHEAALATAREREGSGA
jgi:ketosteroid isomerase-like protein